MASIAELAQQWLSQDRDESTRLEMEQLVRRGDQAELERRLRRRIAFGTAGLRSAMKAGFAHMNSLTVLRASQGLAEYILRQRASGSGGEAPKVAIGYDARHNSEKFARLAAAVFLAKAFRVLWFGRLVHTPMVPFAVTHYAAAAGVMVTASHNPKGDNGYKVYWSNGSQIIPPHDVGIAKAIDDVNDIVSWDTQLVDSHENVRNVFSDAAKSYRDRVRDLVGPLPTAVEAAMMPFTYTPMHGVGLAVMKQLAFLTTAMKEVEAQAQPDPDFPTVAFPNPEEQGALDLAFREASQNNTDIILAHDPDADRFSVAQRLSPGRYHQFTGNQIGILLASHVLETYPGDRSRLAMLASTVSSRMLASMAAKEGFHFQETLTGFKWLGNAAQELKQQGFEPAFAFEEAIGFMFPSVVWDKDGVAAAAMFLAARQRWQTQGLSPWQKLQQLYEAYGFFDDANTYLLSPSPDVTRQVFDDIRASYAGTRPQALRARRIVRWRDLTLGSDTATSDRKPRLPVDPSAQMITCELDDGVVVTARASGTEPKIKLYIEAQGTTPAQAEARAREVREHVLAEWFSPDVYGLGRGAGGA